MCVLYQNLYLLIFQLHKLVIAKQHYWISITIFLSGGFSDKQIQLLLLNQPISLILKSRVPGGVVQSFPYNGYDKQAKYGVNNYKNRTHWPYSNGPSESAYWLNGMKLSANHNVRVSHPYQAYRQGNVSVWIINKIIFSSLFYDQLFNQGGLTELIFGVFNLCMYRGEVYNKCKVWY